MRSTPRELIDDLRTTAHLAEPLFHCDIPLTGRLEWESADFILACTALLELLVKDGGAHSEQAKALMNGCYPITDAEKRVQWKA
jgi:hypothetical protein